MPGYEVDFGTVIEETPDSEFAVESGFCARRRSSVQRLNRSRIRGGICQKETKIRILKSSNKIKHKNTDKNN